MAIHRLMTIRVGNASTGYGSYMSSGDESDQMPEEGPPGSSPDDTGGGESDEGGEKSAGTPGEEAQDGDDQATGNPKNAG
jgi:hypothetical protein